MLLPLTREMINLHLSEMIRMSSQLQGDYWGAEHYLSELNKKWELSAALINKDVMIGFMIVSDKGLSHHLHRIVIRQDEKGKGYGKILMDKLIKDAGLAKKHAVTLKVHPSNTTAISVYEKYGFKREGSDGENYSYKLDLD